MHLTIAVCTWNRSELLREMLASFARMIVPSGWTWEILIIDNNSTDATAAVAREAASLLPIRYVFEGRQGLSRARNRALAEALGDLVIFTDDDVLVDPVWLVEYVSAAGRFPHATFFGGTIDVRFAEPPPRWLRNNMDSFASAYASRRVDPSVRPIATRQELPYGANMGFRREAVADQCFAENLGRIGRDLISGEESDFMGRLLDRGDQGVWIGTARVEHVIPKDRMTKCYIHDYYVWQGRIQVRMKSNAATSLADRRIRKKLKRVRQRLRFRFRRDEAWASMFLQAAVWEGRLLELEAHRPEVDSP